ncbi:unnamed protein product [Microthlaspi erraticum]|uniref:MATH domain-containing protein n=1 Tax=Microthlaspi erraticum TaxID=1685480 RepID=A0A6D2L4P0_9BRAS|nr:unnamed protein product [Microthlaspi erraticum]
MGRDGFQFSSSCSGSFVARSVQMENDADKMFTWVIKSFSSQQKKIVSSQFVIGGCKWQLVGAPNGDLKANYLSLCLMVADFKAMPNGWRRHIKFRLTVVNQLSDKLSLRREKQLWFDEKSPLVGYVNMIPLSKLHAKNGGFLVNNEVKIVAEVQVLEVVGELDVSQEVCTQPLKRTKLNDVGAVSGHFLNETPPPVKEIIQVNGFQVLPSQAESVKRIFERHPDMALEFRAKNQNLRTSCINVLLNLIETMCQSLQDLSIDDLGQAEKAVTYLKDSGFKVDWLEHKLEQVKKKKMEEQNSKTRMQELEEHLKFLKNKCSDIEALLEKEKEQLKDSKNKCWEIEALLEKERAKVLAAKAPPLTLDDLVG